MYDMRIADVDFRLDYKYPRMLRQSAEYIVKNDKGFKPDFGISLDDKYIEDFQRENSHLSMDDCEYLLTGSCFYEKLIEYKGVMLHSSAVVVDGYAYLFSADPGTGKSTHTGLWLEYFGRDRAYILNDDKPALRIKDGRVYAYGTPWSGKTDLNTNRKAPVAGICFIEQAKENTIKKAEVFEAFGRFFSQTVRPYDEKIMDMFMNTINELFGSIPMYIMGCNISFDAVMTAYNTMKEGILK